MSASEASEPPVEASMMQVVGHTGVVGAPDSRAVRRVASSAVSSPSRIQSVGPSLSPLSNTDSYALEEYAATYGAHSSPSAPGSLRSVTRIGASPESRSPNRTPPPCLLNTERPSSASRSAADQYA